MRRSANLGARVVLWAIVGAPAATCLMAQDEVRCNQEISAARDAFAGNDAAAAASHYRRALGVCGDRPELWANLGLMQYQAGDRGKAAESFQTALRRDSSLFVPNLFLGLTMLESKRAKEAVPYLQRAQHLAPQDQQATLGLARAYFETRQFANAARWYSRAVTLNETSADAWYGVGVSYLQRAEEAGAMLTNAHRDSAFFFALSAEIEEQQGRFDDAAINYRKALDLKTELPCVHAGLGFALLGRGAVAAEREFRAELQNNNGCAAARVGLARIAFDAGQLPDALSMIGDMQDPAVLARFAEGLTSVRTDALLEQLRQQGSATAASLAAAIRDGGVGPRPSGGACNDQQDSARAACLFLSGNYEAASVAGHQFANASPNDASGWYWAFKSDRRLAVAALLRASEADVESPRNHLLLGDAWRRQQLYRNADEEYQKALALAPNDPAVLVGLAANSFEDGRLDDASAPARRAVQLQPADPEINLLLSEILVAQGRYDEAEPHLKVSLGVQKGEVARVHALLGKVYARSARPRQAMAELKQALSGDADGSAHYQLGRLYQEMGDNKDAALMFAQCKILVAKRDARDKTLTQ